MKTVWVVTTGIKYEGGSVCAVFLQRPSGAVVKKLVPNAWVKTDDGYWEARGEFLLVKEWEVRS